MFDYSKLRGRIIEKFGNTKDFIEAMNFSKTTFYSKMNNNSDWDSQEIFRACNLLDIAEFDIPAYFFTETVQKTKH